MNGDVAHQVEQRIENPCVAGSSPAVATNNLTNNDICCIIVIRVIGVMDNIRVFETLDAGSIPA